MTLYKSLAKQGLGEIGKRQTFLRATKECHDFSYPKETWHIEERGLSDRHIDHYFMESLFL